MKWAAGLAFLAILTILPVRESNATNVQDWLLENNGCSSENWLPSSPFEAEIVTQGITMDEFLSWFEACERATASMLAKEASITVPAALSRVRANLTEYQGRGLGDWFREFTPYELRERELNAYVTDKSEADRRGITIEALLEEQIAGRIAQIKEWDREDEKRREDQAQRKRTMLIAALTAAVSIMVLLAILRRRIQAVSSRWWQAKTKQFKAWWFLSFSWATGMFLVVWLLDPYDEGGLSYMVGEEILHMLALMVVPPLFVGAVWFGYRRFVR